MIALKPENAHWPFGAIRALESDGLHRLHLVVFFLDIGVRFWSGRSAYIIRWRFLNLRRRSDLGDDEAA